MGVGTGDESSKQKGHHLYPERIAYPDGDGNVSFLDAPWGTTLERAADSKYLPFIKRGHGLPLGPDGRREDLPGPAMEMLHNIRARWIKAGLEQES
jgi:hypothetical protein